MLRDIRVLEISHPYTMLGGRILADLGADVVTVEPPYGGAGRRMEPFMDDLPGLERSLTWQALNYNKRGITLDCSQPDGKALLSQLIEHFDIILQHANDPCTLRNIPDRVIHCTTTSFTPFGPKADYENGDLVLMAASAAPTLAGEPDREPLFFPVPQSLMETGAEMADAALAALAARDRDGQGQKVSLTARVASMAGTFSRAFSGFLQTTPAVREPIANASIGGLPSARSVYACSDGHMIMSIVFGLGFMEMTRSMVRWLIEQHALPPDFADVDWQRHGRGALGGVAPPDRLNALVAAVTKACATRTKLALTDAARTYGFMAAPIMSMKDIAGFPQYRERGLFAPLTLWDGRKIEAPARFIQFSNFSIEIERPAPRLSEHTAEILASELALSTLELRALFSHGII